MITNLLKSNPHLAWSQSVVMFIIHSGNGSNKIEHKSRMNYLKTLAEQLSSGTQGNSKFYEPDFQKKKKGKWINESIKQNRK